MPFRCLDGNKKRTGAKPKRDSTRDFKKEREQLYAKLFDVFKKYDSDSRSLCVMSKYLVSHPRFPTTSI